MIERLFHEHRVLFVLGLIWIVHILVFTGWRIGVDKSMECERYRCSEDPNPPLNYLIAGNVAQPRQAFQFIMDDLEGEVIFCNFRQWGWSAELSAEKICQDINLRVGTPEEPTLVRIYAISCGDQVAQHLEDLATPYAKLEVVAINPQSAPRVLKPYAKWGLRIVAPLLEVACRGAGFLSLIPCIPGTDAWHSPILLADQWWHIAYCEPPTTTTQTIGVVLSSQDEFLLNSEVSKYFAEVTKIEIDTKHADTKNQASKFKNACERIVDYAAAEP